MRWSASAWSAGRVEIVDAPRGVLDDDGGIASIREGWRVAESG